MSISFVVCVLALSGSSYAQERAVLDDNRILGKGEIGQSEGQIPRPVINPIAAEGSRTRPTNEGPIVELPRDPTTLKICNDADSKGVICNSATGIAMPGDANLDGLFDSADLTLAMTSGEFEDQVPSNSTWNDGDWNRDGEFDSSDIRIAFESNRFVHQRGGLSAVPEPNSTLLLLLGMLPFLRRRHRNH